MRYILPCFFAGPVREYHQALVDEIATRFDVPFTRRQAIPAHFTLKYHFDTADIAPVEELLEAFARANRPTSLEVGGFRHFDEDVVWVDVALSAAARATLAALHAALRRLAWLPWGPHDGEHLRPHMTVADGAAITRLDVRLDAVEPERAEGLPEHERERLRHVAPPRIGRADLVAEIPAAEDAAYDLVDVDAAHEGVVGRPADEIARGAGPPPPGQIGGPLMRGHRRHHPAAVEAPARAVEAQELVAVRAARR